MSNTSSHRLLQLNTLFLSILISVVIIVSPSAAIDLGISKGQVFSLKLRDGELTDVLRLLAQEFNLNMIIGEGISGKVTVDFEEVTLTDALDSILKSNGLDYVQDGNILRVDRREKLELEPLVTKTLKLRYIVSSVIATKGKTTEGTGAHDFQSVLEKLLSGRENSGITIIGKTNTLVATDIEQHVDNIIKVAKGLDVPTPQIRIEARVVETTDREQLELGIQWGGKYKRGESTTQGGNITGGAGRSGEGSAINLPASVGKGIGGAIDFTIGKLGTKVLDIQLSALEKDNQVNIVSRPSILVMQNQAAEIHVGSEVPILKGFRFSTSGATLPYPDVEYKKIGVRLGITPQITSEDSIFMSINIEKSDRGDPWTIQGAPYDTINTKNAFTQVMVKNAETVVIGGLYTKKTERRDSGIPYLSKIPLLGWLFKHRGEDSEDAELLIFITPQIVSSPE